MKFEDFRTLIYEIVAIVNSRPSTYVYDEVSSTIKRPMDFLHCSDPTGLALVGTFDDPDYVPPQEWKELFNLYKANMLFTENYWHLLKKTNIC